MKLVLHGGTQQLLVTQFQSLQHQRTVGDVVNGISPIHLLRQHRTGFGSGQVEVRNQSQEFPVRVQGEIDADRQAVVHHGGGQTAVKGRSQVVRVAFHGIGNIQQTLGGQLVAPQHIGAHGARYQQCGRRTQTPAHGDVGIDVDFHTPQLFAHGGKGGAVGYIGQIIGARKFLGTAGDF